MAKRTDTPPRKTVQKTKPGGPPVVCYQSLPQRLIMQLEEMGVTATEIAARVKVSYFTVLRWRKVATHPTPMGMAALEELYAKVKEAQEWDTTKRGSTSRR